MPTEDCRMARGAGKPPAGHGDGTLSVKRKQQDWDQSDLRSVMPCEDLGSSFVFRIGTSGRHGVVFGLGAVHSVCAGNVFLHLYAISRMAVGLCNCHFATKE